MKSNNTSNYLRIIFQLGLISENIICTLQSFNSKPTRYLQLDKLDSIFFCRRFCHESKIFHFRKARHFPKNIIALAIVTKQISCQRRHSDLIRLSLSRLFNSSEKYFSSADSRYLPWTPFCHGSWKMARWWRGAWGKENPPKEFSAFLSFDPFFFLPRSSLNSSECDKEHQTRQAQGHQNCLS